MIDFTIATRLGYGDTQFRITREAQTIGVGLNLTIALTVDQGVDLEHVRQQAAARIARFDVGINCLCEMILVFLCVVGAR